MSDTTVLNGLVTLFKTLEEFDASSVVIDDFSILDGSRDRSPFLILETPDEFISTQQTRTPETIWEIPVTLFVKFTDWTESYQIFRETRFAVIDLMNGVSGERAAGLATPVNIRDIRNSTLIMPWYDPSLNAEQRIEALPLYLFQTIAFQTVEY